MAYDYNTGKLLAPGEAQSKFNMNTGQAIGTAPTVTPALATGAVTPLNIPPAPIDTSAAATMASTGATNPLAQGNAFAESAIPVDKTAQTNSANYKATIDQLISDISGKGAKQAQYEQDAGISDQQKQLNDVRMQAAQEQVAQRARDLAIHSQSGIARPFVIDQAQGAADASARRLADFKIIESAALQNIDSIKSAVKDRIDLEFAGKDLQLKYAEKFYDENQATLADDKKQRLSLAIDKYKSDLADQKEEKNAIYSLGAEAAKNGAPQDVTQSILSSTDKNKALALARLYLRDPLDDQYKRAQINKIYADIEADKVKNGNGALNSPDVMAYASQYAATGDLSNIPEKYRSLAIRAAKELPKNAGTLVSNSTNVSPKGNDKFIEGAAASLDIIKKLEEAKTLFSTIQGRGETGFGFGIRETYNALNPSAELQAYNTLRKEFTDLLARARTGAVINAEEEARYASYLPGTLNKSFFLGPSGVQKIDNLKGLMESKLNTALSAQGASIYGYTKIKQPDGKDYTVGEVYDFNGTKGRMNPDGTVTFIEQ